MAQKTAVQNVKSVKAYQNNIEAEKQNMTEFSKKMKTNVRSLQAKFKIASKDIIAAALKMREEGAKQMATKVKKFEGEIKAQIKEHGEAVSRAKEACRYFQNAIGEKKAGFRSYTKAFWG